MKKPKHSLTGSPLLLSLSFPHLSAFPCLFTPLLLHSVDSVAGNLHFPASWSGALLPLCPQPLSAGTDHVIWVIWPCHITEAVLHSSCQEREGCPPHCVLLLGGICRTRWWQKEVLVSLGLGLWESPLDSPRAPTPLLENLIGRSTSPPYKLF